MSKENIIASVNKLVKLDPNFAENLSKLAELAEKKPFIYQQAVDQLKKL
jgi:hypothetical protein